MVAEIQRSLLPAELPRVPGLELAAAYRPATRAGGDYYDVFERPDGRWAMLIADVSGHGSPAAVLMAIGRKFSSVLERKFGSDVPFRPEPSGSTFTR